MAERMAALPATRIGEPTSFAEALPVHAIKQCTRRPSSLGAAGRRPLEYLPGESGLLEDRCYHELPPRSYSIAIASLADGLMSMSVTRVPVGELAVGFRAQPTTTRSHSIARPCECAGARP